MHVPRITRVRLLGSLGVAVLLATGLVRVSAGDAPTPTRTVASVAPGALPPDAAVRPGPSPEDAQDLGGPVDAAETSTTSTTASTSPSATSTSRTAPSPAPTSSTTRVVPRPTASATTPKPTTATPAPPAPGATIGSMVGVSGSRTVLWGSDADLDRELDAVASSGAKWVRVDFDWPSVQPNRQDWNWQATDRAVAKIRQRGMNVLAVPAYTPAWARPANTDSKWAPTDHDAYATFVSAAVRRYAGQGVKSWEIWNEPNQAQWWMPKPDVAAYTDLLQRAYRAVKAADPGATVVTAGLAPAPDAGDGSQINGLTFVRRMYELGAKDSFDAVGMHPYSFPTSPLVYNSMNAFSGTTPAIHDLMVQRGDGDKRVWLTEFGAPTGGSGDSVSESTQAQIIEDGVTRATGWSWSGPLFVYMYRDLGTDWNDREQNFGFVRQDWSPKPSWARFVDVLRRPLVKG